MAIPTYGAFKRRSDDRRRAGSSAQARFELLLDRWRRRTRGRLAAVYVVLLLPCVAAVVLGSGWWDIGGIFLMGAWTGMLAIKP